MRLTTKVRNPYNMDASVYVDVIVTEPTTNNSRASLLLLNDSLRWAELVDIASELNVNLCDDRIKGYSSAKAIVMAAHRHRFISKKESEGKLVCEYCKSKVFRNKKQNHPRFATIDHKIPQVEGYDSFDDSNYAVCCYRCNQKKNQLPYNEWCVVCNKMVINNSYELNRANLINKTLSSFAERIDNILDNVNDKHRLYQIANLAKISRDFLLKHLSNLDLDPKNIKKGLEDIRILTKMNIIARHKAEPDLDMLITIDKEYKEFFQANKKWSVINNRMYI